MEQENNLWNEDPTEAYRTDFSFSYQKANKIAALILAVDIILFFGTFVIFYGYIYLWKGLNSFVFDVLITIPVIIAGIFAHEILHALALITFGKVGFSKLKGGVNWVNFTPYIHCKFPVSVGVYRISLITPLLFLGIIPQIISLFTGYTWLLFFGAVFTVTSASDLFSFWKIRKCTSNALASDHPDKAGCTVYENPFDVVS